MPTPDENFREIANLKKLSEEFERRVSAQEKRQDFNVVFLDSEDNTLEGKLKESARLIILCNTDDIAFTVDLPQLDGTRITMLTIKKNSTGANDVTISPFAGDKIDLSTADVVLTGAALPFKNFVPDQVNKSWATI